MLVAWGFIASAATALGFWGHLWWVFDLFSHFRVQLLGVLSVVTLFFLLRRRYAAAAVFGLFAVSNLSVIVPLYLGADRPFAAALPSNRAMLINVNTGSGRPDLVARAIKESAPDILILEEISDRWVAALGQQLRDYPYSKLMPRDDNFGIGLYSKHPLINAEIRSVGEAELPSVVAEVQSRAGRFTIVGTHPLPPVSAENTRLRNQQLDQISAMVKRSGSPVLLLGDLNATPWCSAFRRLLHDSGLRDSSRGRGIQPTWPTFMPLMLIPIDHCLYGPGIRVTHKTIGPKVGSDHYPVIIDFILDTLN